MIKEKYFIKVTEFNHPNSKHTNIALSERIMQQAIGVHDFVIAAVMQHSRLDLTPYEDKVADLFIAVMKLEQMDGVVLENYRLTIPLSKDINITLEKRDG